MTDRWLRGLTLGTIYRIFIGIIFEMQHLWVRPDGRTIFMGMAHPSQSGVSGYRDGPQSRTQYPRSMGGIPPRKNLA